MPAVIRYDLSIHRAEALQACHRIRQREELRVAFEVGPAGLSNFRVFRGKEGPFSKCLKNVLLSLPTRSDGGTETVNLHFGGRP